MTEYVPTVLISLSLSHRPGISTIHLESKSNHSLDLKEPLQPPNLKDTLPKQHKQLKDAPPLHPRIRALRRIPMRPLPHNDVPLLILNLRNQLAQMTHLLFQRILRRLRFGHVHDAVHIEGDLLGVGGPVLVAEAVRVPPVHGRDEGVVSARDGAFVRLVAVGWVLDLALLCQLSCQSLRFVVYVLAYPEIYVEVAGAAELAVTDLEGNGHLVVGVQLLVEAFPRVRFEEDIVCGSDTREGHKASYRRQSHGDRGVMCDVRLINFRIAWSPPYRCSEYMRTDHT